MRNPGLKICKKRPPRTVLVKIRISPNEIVILQYIAEEVDSFWVVPVGHAHCRVTWPKIWFQDWKISFLGCFKVASWPVLPRPVPGNSLISVMLLVEAHTLTSPSPSPDMSCNSNKFSALSGNFLNSSNYKTKPLSEFRRCKHFMDEQIAANTDDVHITNSTTGVYTTISSK